MLQGINIDFPLHQISSIFDSPPSLKIGDVIYGRPLRSEPDPPPEAPEVEEISEESGTVTLTWQSNHEDAEVYGDIQYQVEYNRETWDIWLKV